MLSGSITHVYHQESVAFNWEAKLSVHETVEASNPEVVIVERTNWHLRVGALAAAFFICVCIFGVEHKESPVWFWITKGIALFFLLPALIYLLYNLRFQEAAVTLRGTTIRFATMNPWARVSLDVNEILDCSFEAIPESHQHLILRVSPQCYELHKDSSAWAGTSEGEFRFDMIYTKPSPSKCVHRIREHFKSA